MYTKDIIDTKYIIYNTHKPKTLKPPPKKNKGHGHGFNNKNKNENQNKRNNSKFLEDLDATQEDLVLNFQSSCMILVAME